MWCVSVLNSQMDVARTRTASIFDTTILSTLWLPSTIVAKIDVCDANVRGFRRSHEKGRDGHSQASLWFRLNEWRDPFLVSSKPMSLRLPASFRLTGHQR